MFKPLDRPSREELKQLIESDKSLASIARDLNIAHKTLDRWLAKEGLHRHKTYKCKCGETQPDNFTTGRFNECKKCRSYRQLVLYLRYKTQAVEYKGGACSKCGYNKCLAALDFHHLDRSQKDPNWRNMNKRAFKNITKELDKCILLCRNCHTEEHCLENEINKRLYL